MQQLLRQLNQSDDTISETDVKQFCKHSASLAVLRGSCIAEEYDPRGTAGAHIGNNLWWYEIIYDDVNLMEN